MYAIRPTGRPKPPPPAYGNHQKRPPSFSSISVSLFVVLFLIVGVVALISFIIVLNCSIKTGLYGHSAPNDPQNSLYEEACSLCFSCSSLSFVFFFNSLDLLSSSLRRPIPKVHTSAHLRAHSHAASPVATHHPFIFIHFSFLLAFASRFFRAAGSIFIAAARLSFER